MDKTFSHYELINFTEYINNLESIKELLLRADFVQTSYIQ